MPSISGTAQDPRPHTPAPSSASYPPASSSLDDDKARDAEILDQAAAGLSPLLTIAPAHPQPSPPSPDDDVEKQQSEAATPVDGKTADGLTDQTNRLPTRTVLLIFFGVGSAVCISFLDQTIVACVHVDWDLNAGSSASWIATAYLLVSMAFTPTYGRLSDIFGRKTVLMSCLLLFWATSLLCAVAQTALQLIVFRALQGIGGGAILTLVLIMSSLLRIAAGIIEIIIVLSNALGPVVGGAFSSAGSPSPPTYLGWRLCFWINLPLTLVSIAIVYRALPQKPVEGSPVEKLKRIDYGGCVLSLAATILLLVGISLGGVEYAWTSATVLSTIIIGALLLVVFGVYETYVPRLPIIPPSVFRNRTVAGVLFLTFANGASFYALLFEIPLYAQVVYGDSPVRSATLVLPFLCVIAPTVFAIGQGMSRRGLPYKRAIVPGLGVYAVALGLLSTIDETTSVARLVGFQILAGVSVGCTFQSSLVAAQAAVARHEMAVVTATRNTIRLLGGSIFLAVCGALLNNQVANLDLPEALRTAIINDPAAVRSTPLLNEADRLRVLRAYSTGFRTIFIVLAILTALACVIAQLLIQQRSLKRDEDAELKRQGREWLAARRQAAPASSSDK